MIVGSEMLIKLAAEMNEDMLLYELERTVRAYRANKSEKLRNDTTLLCMLLTSKHLVDKHGLDKLLKDTQDMSKLHSLFTGREN